MLDLDCFLLLKQPREGAPDHGSQVIIEPDLQGERANFKKKILCSTCRFPITFKEAESEINGKSHYTFFNPHGLVFDITCFSMADGCVVKGLPSPEFSWFPGFSWQVTVCGRCGKHLGWMFSGASGSFFGLIMRELAD